MVDSYIIVFVVGELGWELYMENSHCQKVYEFLMKAGKCFNIGDFGAFALNSMRIEKGFRAWGADVR